MSSAQDRERGERDGLESHVYDAMHEIDADDLDELGGTAGPSIAASPLAFSRVQERIFSRRKQYINQLYKGWGSVLSREDCEEVIADAILSSTLLKEARRQNNELVKMWWKTDVKSLAVKKHIKEYGTRRRDGTRRGRASSLDTPVSEDGTTRLELLLDDGQLDPAALVDAREEPTLYGAEAATALHEVLPKMSEKHREVIKQELAADPATSQAQRAARMGITVRAYERRLSEARKSLARRVTSRVAVPECRAVRGMLGSGLTHEQSVRVETHLPECVLCRTWQLLYQPAAAAAVVPFPLLSRWDLISLRAQGWVTRTAPAAEGLAAHGETAAVGAGFGGTAAGGALLVGGGTKAAATVCVSVLSCGLALGVAEVLTPSKGEQRPAVSQRQQPRDAGRQALQPTPIGVPLVAPVTLAAPAPDRTPAALTARPSSPTSTSARKRTPKKPSSGTVAPTRASAPATVAPAAAAAPAPAPAPVAPMAAPAPAPAPAPVAPERAAGSSSGPVAPTPASP